MNKKSKLKTYFDLKHEDSDYIETYEKNINFFNDLLKTGHTEDIEYVIPIKMYKYADCYNRLNRYKKALEIIDEIESDLEKIKGQSKFYNQYRESLCFLRGVCLGRLKKFRASNDEFLKLLRKPPYNVRYIEWFKSNKQNYIGAIFNKIAIISMIYYFIMLILGFKYKQLDNFIIRDLGIVIALVSYAISFIWRITIDKSNFSLNSIEDK